MSLYECLYEHLRFAEAFGLGLAENDEYAELDAALAAMRDEDNQ